MRQGQRTARSRPLAGLLAGGLVAGLTVAGCANPTPPVATATAAATGTAASTSTARPCADAATTLVSAVQRAVAGYDQPVAATAPQPASTAGVATSSAAPTTTTPATTVAGGTDPSAGLSAAVTTAQEAIKRYGCPTSTFRADLDAGLAALPTRSPLAAAVLARLAASLTGRIGAQSETRTVSPGTDLASTVATLGAGSTLVLTAGTYPLTQSLVLLEGVTLSGAGRDATVLKAAAPDAAVVVMSPNLVTLSGLRLELDPSVPASGIVAAPQSTLKLTSVTVTGARATSGGHGGAGVQMSGSSTESPSTATTLEVTDGQFDKNAWAGIALSGGHRASIQGSSFTDNGQCGACFLDASSGSVESSRFSGNLVALGANGRSAPTWSGDTVTGGTVGLQLDGDATPTVRDLTVTGSTRAAVIFSGRSAGAIAGTTCASVPYGIVVAQTAAPTLGENGCVVARGG